MRAVVLFAILGCALGLGAAEPETLRLWPEGAPGKMMPHSEATAAFIKKHQSKNTVTDIAEPTITIYRPEKPNGTSVIVAPGGAYVFLSAVHEGAQVCEWLNTLGVTGILLKYRTPTRDEALPCEKPVADARQALKLVRERAKEWKLNPERVGLLGFSAGGNLLAHAACDRGAEQAEVPNFGVMIYGGGFLDPKDPTRLAADFSVPQDAPPMFIACAHDDKTNPVAATLLYLEYRKRNLPAELHLFTHGGHGFGMRDNKQPINQWPARCAEWMRFMILDLIKKDFAQLEHQLTTSSKSLKPLTKDPRTGLLQTPDLTDFKAARDIVDQFQERVARLRSEREAWFGPGRIEIPGNE
jgi:dienelactone hydrolase